MPSGLHCLYDVEQSSSAEHLVDIVAVHGLGEDCIETWTNARTGANWLRDFLPQHIKIARVLTYAYELSPSSFFGPEGPGYIQRTAETFVQELYANRRLGGMLSKPIVFVCHGLGGIIVKKALVYSSTRVAPKVEHLFDTFVSTFAIMFFGTPHDRTRISNWTDIWSTSRRVSEQLDLERVGSGSESHEEMHYFTSITAEFAPHMNAFHLFFFWEELETSFGNRMGFVVGHSSAIIEMDNTEKAGIHANHSDMVKFDFIDSTSYRTVLEALSRYCHDSRRVIPHRWSQARLRLNQLRAGEAYELGGILTFDVHSDSEPRIQERQRRPSAPTHFYPPVDAVDDFVGREPMLSLLCDKFFPDGRPLDNQKRKSFIVFGMGGSGKTQLCAKFAQDYQQRYTSVFTVHAASSKTIEDSFGKIAMVGGLHPTESAGRHFLTQQEAPWLLIIDNADDLSLDLDALFPKGSSAHILVTTRNPRFRKKGSLGSTELQGLAEDEALKLLLTRADIPEPWDAPTKKDGNMIASSLGYLALALIAAGNCICRQICTLSNYLSLHSTLRKDVQRRSLSPATLTLDFRDDVDTVDAVYSAFDVSFDYLQKRETVRSRDAVELLRVSAFYHFEKIPEGIFTRAVTNRRKASGESSENAVLSWLHYFKSLEPPKRLPQFLLQSGDNLSESRVTWALDELQSLSLVSRNAKQGTFSMHPLVHQWARDKLTGKEKTIWASISMNTLLESVVLQLDSGSPKDESDARTDGLFYQSILPHLNVCLEECGSPVSSSTASASKLSILFSSVLQPYRPQIIRAELLNAGKCAVIFGERGQFQKAAVYLGEVKDVLVNIQGLYSERTMLVMHYLSNLYWGLGRLEESIDLLHRVVEARMYASGPEHEQTLIAMSSLGRALWLHGDYVQSLSVLESTTGKMQAVLGESHAQTLAALDNYGVTLGSWYRFEESRKIHERVLDFREKSLGSDDPETLSTKMNLAMALLDLGRIEEAERLMRIVYQKRQQQLGKEHPWTLWALCYLTKVYIEKGSLQEAETLLTWGIEAGTRSLSKDHLGVLMGQGNLAIAFARQGKLEKAEHLTLETLAGLRKSRGVEHPDCVFCQWKLAELYQLQKRPRDAIEQCEQALEIADLRLTRDHPLAKKIIKRLKELQSSQHLPAIEAKQHADSASNSSLEFRQRIRHQITW